MNVSKELIIIRELLGVTQAELAKELGVKDFAAKKIIGYAQRYSMKKIEYCNDLLLRTDEALKSSAADPLQQLTVLIVGIINCLKS